VRRIGVLFVLRLLLVSNAIVVTAVGGLSLAYVERPAGVIGAALCWLFAGCLLGLVPRTDPYRPQKRPRSPRSRS
jgi:lipopolysaccharide export LptBFGC system permease protein LptF